MNWPDQPHPTETEVRAQWRSFSSGKVPDHENVRFYPSLAVALTDITRGLMGMYPNKKHVVRLKGLYRGYSALVRGMSQEGALIHDIDYPKSIDVEELNTVLKKETLCVLMGSDSPWTGEVFPIAHLWQSVIDRKIFAINVSHLPPSQAVPWQSVGSYGIWVHEFPDRSCVVLFGSRYRAVSSIFGAPWNPDIKPDWLLGSDLSGESAVVSDFEKRYSTGIIPKPGPLRLFDWAVVVFDDVDASAVRDILIEKGSAAWSSRLEALSLCRWESYGPFEDLLERGWTLENLRGTLLVSRGVVSEVDSMLDTVLRGLRALQS